MEFSIASTGHARARSPRTARRAVRYPWTATSEVSESPGAHSKIVQDLGMKRSLCPNHGSKSETFTISSDGLSITLLQHSNSTLVPVRWFRPTSPRLHLPWLLVCSFQQPKQHQEPGKSRVFFPDTPLQQDETCARSASLHFKENVPS